jgi:hypothetical protein
MPPQSPSDVLSRAEEQFAEVATDAVDRATPVEPDPDIEPINSNPVDPDDRPIKPRPGVARSLSAPQE